MTDPTGVWDADRARAFLHESTAPIRLSCHTPSGELWMLSLWYEYRDGVFYCATHANADVVSYLSSDDRVAFEVSTNRPPYKGVRGNGRASIEPDAGKARLRSLLERYLGGTDSSLADRLLDPDRPEVQLTITPDRLHTWDFTDRMADLPAPETNEASPEADGTAPEK